MDTGRGTGSLLEQGRTWVGRVSSREGHKTGQLAPKVHLRTDVQSLFIHREAGEKLRFNPNMR